MKLVFEMVELSITAKELKVMKNYKDFNKKEKVVRIILEIINDNESWGGGIPAIDSELIEMGFTDKEAGAIEHQLMDVINRLCKKS